MTDTVVVAPIVETLQIDAPTETVIVPIERVEVLTIGIQGPEGVAGVGSDRYYVHTQNAPADTWTVNHDLGKIPAITIIDSAGTVVYGDVQHVSDDQAIIRFSSAFSGRAICN